MRILVFILLLFFSHLIFAQTVSLSEEISIRNDLGYHLLGKMNNKFLIFRDRLDDFEVQAFDEKMRLSWNKPLKLDKKAPQVVEIVSAKDFNSFSVFYKARIKGESVFKVHKYDHSANMVDSMTIKNFGAHFDSPRLTPILSEDRNILLVYHIIKNKTIEAVAFDIAQMKVLWEAAITPREVVIDDDMRQILLDNKGNSYLICDKNNDTDAIEQNNHAFHIYYFGNNWQTVQYYPISMGANLTYDALFTFDNRNQNLVFAGLYSDRTKARATGIFTLKMPQTNVGIVNHLLSLHPFEDDFVATVLSKKIGNNKGIPEIAMQDIVLRKDGGLVLFVEQNRKYERMMTSARGFNSFGNFGNPIGRYIVDYYLDDILVFGVHPDGKLHWQKILHKKQYSQDDYGVFSSYFVMKTPSNVRLIFNDEISYDTTVSEYVLKTDGEYDRKSLFNTERQQLQLRMRDAVQIAYNEVLIPSEYRNKLRLVRLQY